ncbi:MAG TPA: hypothetical protein VM364_01365 [Vicinamibacterales bacterium]|nr:hypothetical protein [Vicinamibacterales bacterium]
MTEPDLRRIAFVTRRFHALQGLYLATLGAGLIAGTLLWSVMPAEERNVVIQVMLFGQFVMMGASLQIDGYYRRMFGRVPARGLRGGMAAMLPIVLLLGMLADIVRSFQGTVAPSTTAVGLTVFATLVLATDWRQRPYYLLGLAGGCVAAFLSTQPIAFGGPPDGTAGAPLVAALSVVGFTVMMLGLLDHDLLARALTAAAPRDRAAVPASRLLLSGVRLSASVLTLGAVVICLSASGWPRGDGVFRFLFVLSLVPSALMFLASMRYAFCHIGELHKGMSRREREFLERLERLPDGKLPPLPEAASFQDATTEGLRPPLVDPLGHLVLPLSMAAGALIDVASRGTGAPSLLALAFAASQLRIVTRDWPYRRHYLVGALAGGVASVHYMFVSLDRGADWALVSLILVSSAMILEALLDRRLERAGESPGRADVESI